MHSCMSAGAVLLRDIFTLKKSRGGGSIINIDLQFINSGAHFSKCQAAFSTVVTELLFALRWKPSDCSVVKSRRWETRHFFPLFLFLSSQLAEKHSQCQVFGKRKKAGLKVRDSSISWTYADRRRRWGFDSAGARQGSFRSENFQLEFCRKSYLYEDSVVSCMWHGTACTFPLWRLYLSERRKVVCLIKCHIQ